MCGSGGGDDLFGSPSSSDDHPLDDDMLEEIGKQLTEGPSAVRLGSPSRRSHDSPRLDEGPRLDDETASLSLAPSPSRLSAVSSAARSGAPSPVSGDLSWSTLRDHDSAPGGSLHGRPPSNVAKRAALARRLVRLAQQLADGIDVEDSSLLTDQLDFLDKAVARALANGHARVAPSDADSSRRSVHPHSSGLYQSPPSPGHRPSKAHEEAEQAPSGKGGMTGRQAARVVAEATKLNDELLNAMQNLKARQEESEHVQGLLIERAERAAQRIIFLQSRVVYLEDELRANDDELQHIRMCLKAVEVQLPPHPDEDLTRCINVLKSEYLALRRKQESARESWQSSGSWHERVRNPHVVDHDAWAVP